MHTRWQELLEQPLDAVLVLTSSDHAPVAIAAAQAGKHVFVEKPMALCSKHGAQMLDAACAARTNSWSSPAAATLTSLVPCGGLIVAIVAPDAVLCTAAELPSIDT